MNNQKPRSLFEEMGGTYTLGADGLYYPDLILTDEEPRYGKYGRMRLRYLKQHRISLYHALLLEGRLTAHLNEIDHTCHSYMERTIAALAKAEGVTEELKAADCMEWVRRMNNIHDRVEECVLHEYIYDGG